MRWLFPLLPVLLVWMGDTTNSVEALSSLHQALRMIGAAENDQNGRGRKEKHAHAYHHSRTRACRELLFVCNGMAYRAA